MPSRQERRRAQRKQNKDSRKQNKEKDPVEEYLDEYYKYHNVSREENPLFHFQPLIRKEVEKITDKIKVNHCVICGDTEEDGPLILTRTHRGLDRYCEDCHGVFKD